MKYRGVPDDWNFLSKNMRWIFFLGCRPTDAHMDSIVKLSRLSSSSDPPIFDPGRYRQLVEKANLSYYHLSRYCLCCEYNELLYAKSFDLSSSACWKDSTRHKGNFWAWSSLQTFYTIVYSLGKCWFCWISWCSTSGYIVFLEDDLLTWRSKKQNVVDCSFAGACCLWVDLAQLTPYNSSSYPFFLSSLPWQQMMRSILPWIYSFMKGLSTSS